MGRHRNRATKTGKIKRAKNIQPGNIDERIAHRLGLHHQICQDCDARAPPRATNCRKCGSHELRPKAHDYRGKPSNNR